MAKKDVHVWSAGARGWAPWPAAIVDMLDRILLVLMVVETRPELSQSASYRGEFVGEVGEIH